MIKHHLLIMMRNAARFKNTFIINLIGLSSGLAAALLIYLWAFDEVSIDRFHQHQSHLYQVMRKTRSGDDIQVAKELAPTVAEALKAEFPEVEFAVAEGTMPVTSMLTLGNKHIDAKGAYVSPGYFSLFSYGIKDAAKTSVLNADNNIVISRELAVRIFGDNDPVGQMLDFDSKETVMVSGVYDMPANSSMQFDFALPFNRIFVHVPTFRNDWHNSWPSAYVILKDGTDVADFNTKLEDFYEKKSGQAGESIFVTPYADQYLYGNFENGERSGGRIQYVRLFIIIGAFIIGIAAINFANLSTARASQRMKEIGVKKVFGVSRKSLTFQYLFEAVVMSLVSFILAVVIDLVLLPQFNLITGKQLSFHPNIPLMFGVSGIILITALLAGAYPALYLSGFSPAVVLKGRMNTSTSALWIRKGLVVVQFSLSVIFMFAVFVVYQQLQLIQSRNMGYSRDEVIYFEMGQTVKEHRESFVEGLRALPGVGFASDIWWGFLGDRNSTADVSWPGKDPNLHLTMQYRRIDDDLIETLGIRMNRGKSFNKAFPASHSGVIVNEAAVAAMGLKDPVGTTITVLGKPREIIGVTDDFHFKSLYETVEPLFFIHNPERANTVMVKIAGADPEVTINSIRAYHNKLADGVPLDVRFLDEDFQAQYANEKRVEVLSKYFTLIAITISCLGLFGLATYTAERRAKEVGVRKTLGASESGLVLLLTRDFTKNVMIAITLALPIAYVITSSWLDRFKVRVSIDWYHFVLVGLVALLIACATVGFQAQKAAKMNPAAGLRAD